MADETISDNMSLPIPGVAQTLGPTWALDLNACLTIIDAHDHTAGNGVLITPTGISINADLPFGSNSATGLLKAAFNSQSGALSGTNFLSFVGGNLYVNDGSGNQIAMTAAGGVAGTPGSIGSLTSPASASYSAGSKTFTWASGSSKAAAMDNGAVIIRETDVASAKGITLASPTSLAADYQVTLLTALPGSTQLLNITSSGSLGNISYDGVGTSMTTTGATAIQNISTTNYGISSSISFSGSATSPANITGASAVITSNINKVVKIQLIPNGAGTASFIQVTNGFALNIVCLRDGISFDQCQMTPPTGSLKIPASSVVFYDFGGAGSHTYSLQYSVANASAVFSVSGSKLLAIEE